MAFRSKLTLRRFAEAAWDIFCLSIVLTSNIDEVGSINSTTHPHPNAKLLGGSYDIVKGNPDGQTPWSTSEAGSGLDPGFQLLRIIEHTYEEKKIENGYLIPDDVEYTPRSLTTSSCKTYAVYGSRSYENVLGTHVKIGVGTVSFTGFMFGASGGFEKFSKRFESEQSVYLTMTTLRTFGEGRIQPGYTLTHEFSSELCELPTEYLGHEEEYHQFLNKWGTHVVTRATFGQSEHTLIQYQLSKLILTEARRTSGGVSIGGSYKGFSASVALSGSHDFNFKDYNAVINGSLTKSVRGSLENNEPIEYTLEGMDTIMEDGPCNYTLAQNMKQALESYPAYQGANESADPDVFRFPLTWPDGTYSLPRSSNGCPEGKVSWAGGSRLFDTYHDNGEHRWEPANIHLDLPIKEETRMKMKFCTKTTSQSANYRRDWDSGTYCIFRSDGDTCPRGFKDGFIFWNDDGTGKDHDYEGRVPAGDYTGGNTNMSFCCREDAEVSNVIILPVEHDFFLMTPTGHCQEVFGMQSTKEKFYWDTHDSSEVGGLYPYPGLKSRGILRDVEIVFCYYQRNNSDAGEESSDRQRRSTTDSNPHSQGPCSDFEELLHQASPAGHVCSSCVTFLSCILSGIMLACKLFDML